MRQFKPMDPACPIQQQIAIDAQPVVLVDVFTLAAADEADFLAVWKDDAAFMKRQPGFISTQLHRALGDSPTCLNYAIRESTAAFRAAFTHPEFVAKLSASPSSAVVSPHLFQKVGVAGICTAQARVRIVAARGIPPNRERGLLHRKCWQACGYPAHRDAKPLIRWTLARVMQTRRASWPSRTPLRRTSHHDATTPRRCEADARPNRSTPA